jgi:hypothetical protein
MADLDVLGRMLLPTIQSPDEPPAGDTDDGRKDRREIRVGKTGFAETDSHSWARTQKPTWPLQPGRLLAGDLRIRRRSRRPARSSLPLVETSVVVG